MSQSARAIDALEKLAEAVTSQLGPTCDAPNVLIECYRERDGVLTWTIFANDNTLDVIGGPAPTLEQAALSIVRARA